jgi:hypothetical protein
MKSRYVGAVAVFGVIALAGCGDAGKTSSGNSAGSSSSMPRTEAVRPAEDGTIPSSVGTEKEKPAAGKGNVQGKVFFNEKPAPGIEVKLSEKFSRFLGGASGATFTTKTDANGEYLIKNVKPGVYEGLLVRVFNSNSYVFATSGIISAAKYEIEPDKTYFAPDTNLFKSDLRLLSPKAGAKLPASGITIKWKPYPDAASYKLSVNADTSTGAKTDFDLINKRIDGDSYALDKPLTAGTYSVSVTAYNANDVKLAESPDDIKFTIKP